MKFLKFLVLLLITSQSFGQYYTQNKAWQIFDNAGFKNLFIANDTTTVPDVSKNYIAIKNAIIYYWNGSKWAAISGTGAGGTSYTLPQATPTTLGGIKYNTDFYIDANGRLGIDTLKKAFWNTVANLPLFYAKGDSVWRAIHDTAINHDLAFTNKFTRTGNTIDLVELPFTEKDSIALSLPSADLTIDDVTAIRGINDTSIHPQTVDVRNWIANIKRDTINLAKNQFYRGTTKDSIVYLNIRKINGINLYGDTNNIVIAGGGGSKINLTTNNSTGPATLDTTTNTLNIPNYFYATNSTDSIDYSFSSMTTIYNEAGPGEYSISSSGVTANKDNLSFPFRQLKSLDIGGWNAGDYVSYHNASNANTTAYTFLRCFVRLKLAVPISQSLSFQFYSNGVAISKVLSMVNYGLDKNKVAVYQPVTIPMSAFGFTSNSFDEIRLIFGGGSSANGIYLDLFQFQNATAVENTYITDVFKKQTTDSVFKVLGGQNVFAFKDSAGTTIDTVSLLAPYLKSSVATTSYFPLAGGSITGTAGNGYVGFIPQTSTPATPTSGFKLFATSPGALAWITSLGYARELRVRAQTQSNIYYLQDKSYTLADSADVAAKESALTFNDPLKRTGNTISADTTTAITGLVTKGFLAAQGYGSGGGGTAEVKQTYTSGSTVTINNTTTWMVINPASTVAALTITTPATPTDAQRVEISFGGTITTGNVITALTVAGNTGQTVLQATSPTSVAAGESISYRYNSSNSKWYRVL